MSSVWLQRNAYLRSLYDFLSFISSLVYFTVTFLDAMLACGFQKAIKELLAIVKPQMNQMSLESSQPLDTQLGLGIALQLEDVLSIFVSP